MFFSFFIFYSAKVSFNFVVLFASRKAATFFLT